MDKEGYHTEWQNLSNYEMHIFLKEVSSHNLTKVCLIHNIQCCTEILTDQ